MSLQTVDGRYGYVVEFDKVPELPITWAKRKEERYAQALAMAIHNGTITKPGKYLIVITGDAFEIFTINEDEKEEGANGLVDHS